MPTNKQTISVRLNAAAKSRVERAAGLSNQSSGAFLEKAGEDKARQVLVAWAIQQRKQMDVTFSDLASETGLAIEELMVAVGENSSDDMIGAFLSSCRAIADASNDPEFFRAAERAVQLESRE